MYLYRLYASEKMHLLLVLLSQEHTHFTTEKQRGQHLVKGQS